MQVGDSSLVRVGQLSWSDSLIRRLVGPCIVIIVVVVVVIIAIAFSVVSVGGSSGYRTAEASSHPVDEACAHTTVFSASSRSGNAVGQGNSGEPSILVSGWKCQDCIQRSVIQ